MLFSMTGISFNQIPGQSTKVDGISKSLIAYSFSNILKKYFVVASPNPIAHVYSYVVNALLNYVESD